MERVNASERRRWLRRGSWGLMRSLGRVVLEVEGAVVEEGKRNEQACRQQAEALNWVVGFLQQPQSQGARMRAWRAGCDGDVPTTSVAVLEGVDAAGDGEDELAKERGLGGADQG